MTSNSTITSKKFYLDSDTKITILTNSPSVEAQDWFIPQDQVFKTRAAVNAKAGTRRMLAHFTITPGWDGWLDKVDEGIERYKPDSWKGYSVGDNTHKELDGHPWRADDEKLMYPFYEKIAKAGINNVCIHKGLFAPAVAEKFPRLLPYADVSDIGQIFAWTAVAQPRLAAALMGMLVKGLGSDRIVWGTDAVWTGAPQWQIEGLRRLEIPEDMQKKYGFKPLGPADGPIKTAIFGDNSARLYGLDRQHAERVNHDRFAAMKSDYLANGGGRSNLRYGYVARSA